MAVQVCIKFKLTTFNTDLIIATIHFGQQLHFTLTHTLHLSAYLCPYISNSHHKSMWKLITDHRFHTYGSCFSAVQYCLPATNWIRKIISCKQRWMLIWRRKWVQSRCNVSIWIICNRNWARAFAELGDNSR